MMVKTLEVMIGDFLMKDISYVHSSYSVCFLHSIRKRRYNKDQTMQHRYFPVPMLIFIIEGKGTLLIDENKYDIEPLQLYVFKPGMAIEFALKTEYIEYYTLTFRHFAGSANGRRQAPLQLQPMPLLQLPSGLIPVQPSTKFPELIHLLYAESRKQPNELTIQLQFGELLHLIVLASAQPSTNHMIRQSIQQITSYMRTQFSNKIDMGMLAAMAGMTASSFSRLFKKTIGVSPIDYLTQLRMESAKALLSKPGCKIKEVSSAVGYENEFYFSRMFQQKVGVSPTFFITRYRLKIAVAACLPYHDSLQSLGIEPVAIVNCFKYPGMDDAEHTHILSNRLKELQQAQPDVIIADLHHRELHEQLSRIAPTVMFTIDKDWITNYRDVAELLGRHHEAERELNQLALHTTAARRLLHRNIDNQTVTVMQVNHIGVRIQGTVDHPLNELIYQDLGLKPGRNMPLQTKSIELEAQWLPRLETDYLFIQKNHLRAGSETIYEQMRGTYAWSSIKAVQTDQVKLIPNWFSMSWTPAGRKAIMDQLLELTSNKIGL
jgi:AraC-like DNA-binding protein